MTEEELILQAKNLVKEFHNLEEFKQYEKIKKAISKNKRLKFLSSEIKKHKDNLPLLGKQVQLKTLVKIKELKDEYDSHPLVVNYNQLKNQLIELLTPLTDLKI